MKIASFFSLALNRAMATVVAAVLTTAPCGAATLKKPAGQTISAPDPVQKIQRFRLATGGEFDAAIVGFSLQSRVITMKLPNGNTSHVAPRELTAASKLKWLTSAAFWDAARQLKLPDGWLLSVIENVWMPVLGVMIASFFCFWGGVSVVSGMKTFPRAAKTYGKMLGISVLMVLVSIAAQYALAMALEGVAILPMIRSAVLVGGCSLAVLTAYGQIGTEYGLSGGPQFGVVLASGGIAFTFATLVCYVLPRVLQRPGLDDWFTDSLLAPLGLA